MSAESARHGAPGGRSWKGRIRAALVLAVLSLTLVPTPVAQAGSGIPCSVRNVTQDTRDTSFRRMVAAAHRGDRLRVRGTCSGGVTIRKDLVIVGVGPDATLSGRGRSRVLDITPRGSHRAHVRLRDIRIARGRSNSQGPVGEGGGIRVRRGILTLTDSIVAGNTGGAGGGIGVWQGVATMRRTVVQGNTAGFGGGIWARAGTVTLIDSVVRGNRADLGGGIDNWDASVALVDSTVRGNTAEFGGGIHTTGDLRLLRSNVRANMASIDGGGIHSDSTNIGDGPYDVELVESTLTGNTAGGRGAGILAEGGDLQEVPVYEAVIALVDTTVRANRAGLDGGGIYAFADTLLTVTVSGSSAVTSNHPNDCVGTAAC
jgi:predicted outer membrane repeat protein